MCTFYITSYLFNMPSKNLIDLANFFLTLRHWLYDFTIVIMYGTSGTF